MYRLASLFGLKRAQWMGHLELNKGADEDRGQKGNLGETDFDTSIHSLLDPTSVLNQCAQARYEAPL